MGRRCRTQGARPCGFKDPHAADLVRRLRGLLAIVRRPPEPGLDAVQSDDELLDRI